MRPRPRSLAVLFGGYFAIVTFSAYAYALGTTGAWYVGLEAFAVYTVTILGALVLLVGLGMAAFAAARAPGNPGNPNPGIASRLADLEARVQSLTSPEVSEQDLDAFLDSLATDKPEDWATHPRAARVEQELNVLQNELAAIREELAHAGGVEGTPSRGKASRTLVGPALVAMLFFSVSAIMLPGIEGFAQANYVLSNTIIFALTYNWPGLVAYAFLSVVSVLRGGASRFE